MDEKKVFENFSEKDNFGWFGGKGEKGRVDFLQKRKLFRPLKGAPKSAQSRDKIAKSGQDGPKISIFYAKRGIGLKNVHHRW